MLNAYRNKKDLYSTIAMGVYNNKYEDNLEHYPDGTLNSAGKERRSSCKSLLLGGHTFAQIKLCEHYYSMVS